MNAALHSSEFHGWRTPADFFDRLHAEFGFTLDAAASADNALCVSYFTQDDDALRQDWTGSVWCNPPYGRTLGRWLAKARRSAESGSADVVVVLVPARTDTAWWHEHVMRADEVRLVAGRLRFSLGDQAPFPCAVVIFSGRRPAPRFSAMPARLTSSPRLDLVQELTDA